MMGIEGEPFPGQRGKPTSIAFQDAHLLFSQIFAKVHEKPSRFPVYAACLLYGAIQNVVRNESHNHWEIIVKQNDIVVEADASACHGEDTGDISALAFRKVVRQVIVAISHRPERACGAHERSKRERSQIMINL